MFSYQLAAISANNSEAVFLLYQLVAISARQSFFDDTIVLTKAKQLFFKSQTQASKKARQCFSGSQKEASSSSNSNR